MTQEQKAKAYDKAKLRISAAYNSNRCTIGFMNEIFPELCESEDGRIRKALIYHYQGDGCICANEYRIDYKDIRAWLEKQGEQKLDWSEEDERMYRGLHNLIYVVQDCDCDSKEKLKFSDWLKSLKDRVQPKSEWKPSDEQLEVFEHFVRCICESGYDNKTKLLRSLLFDLKKLKGE